jgi:SAM-dependent methyltransferase
MQLIPREKKPRWFMDGTTAYSSKAENYARYRWDYAPKAIDCLVERVEISQESEIADIGSGTGILSKHFAGRVARLFAVEPNAEMRGMAEQVLGDFPAFENIDGSAEATTLGDRSVDVIAVAQAIHWFNPEPTRREFLRIGRSGCWLALLRNYGTDEGIGKALWSTYTEENGAIPPDKVERPPGKPVDFYYGDYPFETLIFPFAETQSWEVFLGAALSASFTPSGDHPRYPRFEREIREVFETFSVDGLVEMHGKTELQVGKIRGR